MPEKKKEEPAYNPVAWKVDEKSGWVIDEKAEEELANDVPKQWPKENPHILDSGDRTEFATGAVRDIQKGKGRCDLMPLRVAANVIHGDAILDHIGLFQDTGDTSHLYIVLRHFAHVFNGLADMLLEVSKHFEEGAEKYGEHNWQKGIPVNRYIDSMTRHYLKCLRIDNDEPHARAFVWNVMCCIWEVDYSPRAKEKA